MTFTAIRVHFTTIAAPTLCDPLRMMVIFVVHSLVLIYFPSLFDSTCICLVTFCCSFMVPSSI